MGAVHREFGVERSPGRANRSEAITAPVGSLNRTTAVENEGLQFALQVGLHLQEFEPQHLWLQRDRVGAVEPNTLGFVNERVCLRGWRLDQSTSPAYGRNPEDA
jgi:hypothetical protein